MVQKSQLQHGMVCHQTAEPLGSLQQPSFTTLPTSIGFLMVQRPCPDLPGKPEAGLHSQEMEAVGATGSADVLETCMPQGTEQGMGKKSGWECRGFSSEGKLVPPGTCETGASCTVMFMLLLILMQVLMKSKHIYLIYLPLCDFSTTIILRPSNWPSEGGDPAVTENCLACQLLLPCTRCG